MTDSTLPPQTSRITSMANKKFWIKSAIRHPGSLRKTLGVKEGQKIPESKLEAAAHGGGVTAKRARLAMTLKGLHHR